MYEDLIMHLRKCAEEWNYDTYAKAADAIENLDYIAQTYIETVHELEDKNRWISCSERLPEKPYGCLAIVWDNPYGGGDPFLNYYPEYIGFDGESWNDGDGEEIPFEVVYWMKMPEIPEPPKEET